MPASVAEAFDDARHRVARTAEPIAIGRWQDCGQRLRQSCSDSPTILLWLKHSPSVLNAVGVHELENWTHRIIELGERAPELANAFIVASEQVLPWITPQQRDYWADMGLRLSAYGWKSVRLACELFDNSKTLLEVASTASIDTLVNILCDIQAYSAELATSCLRAAPAIFARLPAENHDPFLALGAAVARRSRADIWLYFERGPDLLETFSTPGSNDFVELAVSIVTRAEEALFLLLSDLSAAISAIPEDEHRDIYNQAARIAQRDTTAAAAFLKILPRLRELIGAANLSRWVDMGLAGDEEDAIEDRRSLRAWFNMESSAADRALAGLSGRIEFERTGNLLQMFGQALAGEAVHVRSLHSLNEKRLGWRTANVATTDGHTIFVPSFIDMFGEREANFETYKVCIAHQTGRLQFGSFAYRYGADGAWLETGELPPDRPALVPMQRYFDLFSNRELAEKLFAIVEDGRIDACVRVEYPGLALALSRTRNREIDGRASPAKFPLRRALLENLLRASMHSASTLLWPGILEEFLATTVGAMKIAFRPGATVQDSAIVTQWLYDAVCAVPNVHPGACPGDWQALSAKAIPDYVQLPPLPALPRDFPTRPIAPEGQLELPEFRSGFKPEMVQTLDALSAQPDLDELDRDSLEQLIENSVEIEDESLTADQLLQQLEVDRLDEVATEGDWQTVEDDAEGGEEASVISWSRYDEWDFRANDYLHGWCQVGERRSPEGDAAWYEDTLSRHHGLVLDIRKQFEMMRPESHRKIRNLEDGHEIDLEQAIQFFIDKKAGTGPSARFYSRREKIERSVAVAFLLDMSWSTDDLAGKENTASRRRIIDIERDATVLIIEALEAIGDSYGIYGFSGYGRNNVSFHVIKDLDEVLDEGTRKRVEAISPLRSTRMGAAIRHARARLDAWPAKVKLMIVISDGRPQDQGYGQTRDDMDYALHDTHQALLEVKRGGMVPFVITVDREGPDYLEVLCGDIGYEIVTELESLPRRLPAIYRWLANCRAPGPIP